MTDEAILSAWEARFSGSGPVYYPALNTASPPPKANRVKAEIVTHGKYAYDKLKCRCEICRSAKREQSRARQARKSAERAKLGRMPGQKSKAKVVGLCLPGYEHNFVPKGGKATRPRSRCTVCGMTKRRDLIEAWRLAQEAA